MGNYNSIVAVDVGDIDGDGSTDLVVAAQRIVSVLLNQGDGTAFETSAFSVNWSSLEVADLDEDGDLDLLLTENDGPARLFLNAGAAPQAIELHGHCLHHPTTSASRTLHTYQQCCFLVSHELHLHAYPPDASSSSTVC